MDSFEFSQEAALRLYKPIFIRRLIIAIALIALSFILAAAAGLFSITSDTEKESLKSIAAILSLFVVLSIYFFFYNLMWYVLKRSKLYKYSKIKLVGSIVEYNLYENRPVESCSFNRQSEVWILKAVNKVQMGKEYVTVYGNIKRSYSNSADNQYSSSLTKIKIPKVYAHMDELITLLKNQSV